MQVQSSEAIVLRRTEYGEADRIVTFLTPELGRIGVLAKAVRKPSSKLAGGIEPFALLKVTVRKGRGELWTLTSSQMQAPWTHIVEDFERLQFAYAVLKKINQASETLHEPELYELLRISMESLHEPKIDIRITTAWFHAHFLQILGVSLNLSRDVGGNKLQQDERYRFSVDDMSFARHPNGEFQANHLKVLKLLHLRAPVVIAHIGGVEEVIDDCARLLRGLNE